VLGELELLVEASRLLTNGLSLSVTIYYGTPYRKMTCVRRKSSTFLFLTSFNVIASVHLGKIMSGCYLEEDFEVNGPMTSSTHALEGQDVAVG